MTWVPIIPPIAILLKDIIATIAVLSAEPGITAKASRYYAIALLPGSLVVNTGSAMVVNLIFAAFMSFILYLLIINSRRI